MTRASAADAADRRLIREGLDRTVIVEAAAGTGKTTELVARILNVLATGRAEIHEIVAVTFTEKAAGELKLRLRQELDALRQATPAGDVRDRLGDAIKRLEEAHVSTIHGFCADLLRERPVEARVDPSFIVLNEAQADRLFDGAFEDWLQNQREAPPEGVRRALRRSVWSPDGPDRDQGPTDRVRRAARDFAEWRDFDGVWQRDPFDRHLALHRVLDVLRAFTDLARDPSSNRDPLFASTKPARELSDDVRRADLGNAPDPDGWEARAVDLAQDRDFRRAIRGREKRYSARVARDELWQAYQDVCDELDRFQRDADADLAASLHGELQGALEVYTRHKARLGALDFVDLLIHTRDLIKNVPEVRRAFQRRFTHLFVDEFQDTDPLQAEILLLLAAGDPGESTWRAVKPHPGKLFIVGDPKQAIYRFRRADVQTYRDVWDLLEKAGATPAKLTTSFRATPNLQRAVNAAFAPVMTGAAGTLQADYVELRPHRGDVAGQPSFVALPVPEPYGKRQVAGYAIDKSLPAAVAAFVDWLIHESGWHVTERTSRTGEVEVEQVDARHVCILFRRFLHYEQDVTRPYVEALEARGIRHQLVGGKSFHEREEVETIRAALAAIEWPDDELSVFATLRGALFAIGDEELLDHEADETARDRAEGERVAYVAATRARDLLVVPAVGDAAWDGGWVS
ncbi:MAG: UvrD-helicase domain-containing protein, partial [Acidobacteria bacterium]|nr:UvrD-helicase domain-containing protein [Acidobacteriota bacterium]